MKKSFEDVLLTQMAGNEKIALFLADEDHDFCEKAEELFSRRVFRFGIAECNMVGAAAAFSKEGFIPVVYTFDSFLSYRAYEFIRNDICLNDCNVKIVGMGGGLRMNNLGATHHATENIAALRVLPNLAMFVPASPRQIAPILEKSIERTGSVYIRLGKAFETEIFEDTYIKEHRLNTNAQAEFCVGKPQIIKNGEDVTIISTGNIIAEVIAASDMLEKTGIDAEIINLPTIKPLEVEAIIRSAQKTKCVITVEEHQISGGIGGLVAEILIGKGSFSFERLGLNDTFCNYLGWHKDLLAYHCMDAAGIYNCATRMIRK
ncbi:MAG: transketolase [Spirochaetota bacterium]|jgi:transketolase|nr:transketolase [Spirochaetota bacterium]